MTYSGFTTPPRARSRPGTSYPRPPRGARPCGAADGTAPLDGCPYSVPASATPGCRRSSASSWLPVAAAASSSSTGRSNNRRKRPRRARSRRRRRSSDRAWPYRARRVPRIACGRGGGERGRDGAAPTGDDPVSLRELEPDPVRDVPDRGGVPEESLDLIPARHGELRGDGAPPAAIEVAEARPHVALEPGARPGCQGPRRHGIGDQGDVAIVIFQIGRAHV